MSRKGSRNLDYKLLAQIYDAPVVEAKDKNAAANQTGNRDASAGLMLPKLLDTEQVRINDMNANGVDMHLLSLALPGVQIFESKQADELARLVNDRCYT